MGTDMSGGSITPCSNKRGNPGQTRVQVQDSHSGTTEHTVGSAQTGTVIVAPDNYRSVSVRQMQAGMAGAYASAAAASWFPNELLPQLGGAIVEISKKLNDYPPGGIALGRSLGFESEQWSYFGHVTYRIDLDNLRGQNLRVTQ